jgi:anaerobic magnesium-protoporphyrin IX monomethyl ester cyclase
MKIVILAPNPPDCVSFGPRQLASLLRTYGHEVSVVFLRGSVKKNRFDSRFIYQYPPAMLTDIEAICKDADVIGVSFMSLYYDRGVQLTRTLKAAYPNKPIIWGGTHATLRPEESIKIADFVCVGEGEIAFTEWLSRLANGGDLTSVPGIWARTGDEIIRNGEAPEVPDLNTIPWPDMDTEGHWVDDGGRIVPMSTEMMHKVLPRLPYFNGQQHIGIRFMATRGCPHRCTYCASSAQATMRRRTVESTMQHMEWLKDRYPFLETMYEFDDTFFATQWGWLKEFAEQYKQRIGLPWHCQTSPSTLTRKKLDMLVDAGLVYCEMGVQSGSAEIKELFQRTETEQQVERAAAILHEYYEAGKLQMPRYHIITDVPWEPNDSVLSTINLLLTLPRPFKLAIGSLCLFPGTHLNDRAFEDGILWDEVNQVYRKPFLKPQPNMLNWLIYASGIDWIPQDMLRNLAARPDLLDRLSGDGGAGVNRLTRTLHAATDLLDRVPRALDAIRNQDLDRIKHSFTQPQ